MTPLLLGILALGLAGPVPALLGGVAAFASVPRAAVVLWQSVALGAVLAAVGSGLSLALWLVTKGGRAGGLGLGPLRIAAHLLVLALTVTVLARLSWAVTSHAHRLRAIRRRHRDLVDLAGSAPAVGSARVPAGVLRVLRHDDVPTAYCVPALHDSRVVVSDAAIARLGAAELDAVLAHEISHLHARHDLVIEVFTALWIAFPRGVRSRVALEQVRTLLEMTADDDAVRVVGTAPVARALVALASGETVDTPARLERLVGRDEHARSRSMLAAATCLLAAALLVVPTATVAGPWIVTAWSIVG